MFESLFRGLESDSLYEQFRRFESQVDQLFGNAPWPAGIRAAQRGAFPPLNVGATADQVHVYLFAAGIDPKSLDVSLQQNLLAVAGTRKLETDEAADYYRQERFAGEFRRVITLPDDVDPDRVNATYRDGVLHISIQRRESARPRQISVN
jgi:HSP20 family protein